MESTSAMSASQNTEALCRGAVLAGNSLVTNAIVFEAARNVVNSFAQNVIGIIGAARSRHQRSASSPIAKMFLRDLSVQSTITFRCLF